jgi:hypothetical protein
LGANEGGFDPVQPRIRRQPPRGSRPSFAEAAGHLRRTNRTRLGAALAVCLLAHLGLVVLLAREHPVLKSRPLGPAMFEVTVVPMFFPEPVRSPKPRPLLRVRRAHDAASPPGLPPLLVPDLTPGPPPLPLGPPPHLTPELGATLRRALGCTNIASPSLSQAERDNCLARLGAGARSAPYIPSGLNRDKQDLLDRAAAAKEAYRRYRDGPVPPGMSHCDFGCSPHDLTGEGPPAPKHPF